VVLRTDVVGTVVDRALPTITGENCGHTASSITGQACTTSGCKSPVIVFTGGVLSQPATPAHRSM
jgi:hypothetical protein